MMDRTNLDKVVAFVVANRADGPSLLLFRHAGIQLPAGTVEAGEDPETGAIREAQEETGLPDVTLVRKLSEAPETLAADESQILTTTPVYTRADGAGAVWATLRNGLRVRILRSESSFSQVEYIEINRNADPNYKSFEITGWIPSSTIARTVTRHFYLFSHHGDTPDRWDHQDEGHTFSLFWSTLADLPALNPWQQPWLDDHFLSLQK